MKAAVLFLILMISVSYADFRQDTKSTEVKLNPKQITEATFRIVKSGTLEISGDMKNATLTMAIPQVFESIKISAESYKIVEDKNKNSVVKMTWKNPKGSVDYSVEVVVKNYALYTNEKGIRNTNDYTKESSQLAFTPALREVAFPFERSMKKAAELASWVNQYVEYDLSLVGQLKPSDWVYDNRKGVCVEYANLLGSLLRISGIPTRYVVGYAYSSVQNKLIGHTWVEVQASDGSWIPFDATWLQGGYLDATHIKTAIREDANQTEQLNYVGFGSINWKISEDEIEMLDYKLENTTSAFFETEKFPINGQGYIKANIQASGCTIVDVNVSSCRTQYGDMLHFKNDRRKIWVCNEEEIYWFFDIDKNLNERFSYTCPVIVFDQTGLQEIVEVNVAGEKEIQETVIEGPSFVKVNEEFTLIGESDEFIFYSPDFGRNEDSVWNLKITKPGDYKFYLYSENSVAEKTVSVVKEKEFEISADAPDNVTAGGSFLLNVSVKNLKDKKLSAALKVYFEDYVKEEVQTFDPKEIKFLLINLSSPETGNRKIEVFIEKDSIAGYSTSINVYADETKTSSFLSDLIRFVLSFFGL
jgi:hypothetical protein